MQYIFAVTSGSSSSSYLSSVQYLYFRENNESNILTNNLNLRTRRITFDLDLISDSLSSPQ